VENREFEKQLYPGSKPMFAKFLQNKEGLSNTLGHLVNVRSLLLSIVGMLVLFIIFYGSVSAFRALDSERDASLQVEVSGIVNEITAAQLALSAERGTANTALGFELSADAGFKRLLNEQRTTFESAFSSAHEGIDALPEFTSKAEKLEAVDSAYEAYLNLQAGVDAAMNAAAASRARRIDRQMFSTITDLIERLREMRVAITSAFPADNPEIAANDRLQFLLWTMQEYASRDWGSVGEAIASGDPLSSIKLQVISNYGGHIESAWQTVKSLVESPLISSELRGLLEDVRESYFGEYTFARDEVYAAAEIQEPYPFTAMEWIEKSTEALAPVSTLSDQASALSQQLAEDSESEATANMWQSALILLVTLTIGGSAFWFVIRRVAGPLVNLSGTMSKLAEGDLEAEVKGTERTDEIGDMARAVQVFKDNALEKLRLEEEQRRAEEQRQREREEAEKAEREREEAERRREAERQEEEQRKRRDEMLQLADQFESQVMNIVQGVSSAAGEMQRAAQELSETAEDTTGKSEVVAKTAEQANSSLQMVASAAEELSSSVREIAGQTSQSSSSAKDAVKRTERASEDIQALVEAARRIGDVVNLINDIAEQTNLLALNATIEAARAGEAGKGFAVVASEVKSLANQTGKATSDISEQISDMQGATDKAVKAIEAIQSIIGEIDSTAVSIASSVEQQDASTQEIARNVSEVSQGAENITRDMTSLNEGAATTGAAAGQVLGSAKSLTEQSETLRKQVEDFLASIRAA